jgi:hypothetical protein
MMISNRYSPERFGTKPFLDPSSKLAEFLADDARDKFEKGIKERLKDKKHSQGTLLPSSSSEGAVGPVRFLQYRSGTRPLITNSGVGGDLATAVGAYYIHSALWVQAKITKSSWVPLSDTTYEVTVLRWCVQVYDCYDWNVSAATPIPVPDSLVQNLAFPPEAVNKITSMGGFTVIQVRDKYFRDLEVSGGGKAYMIYTDPFPCPSSVAVPWTITL